MILIVIPPIDSKTRRKPYVTKNKGEFVPKNSIHEDYKLSGQQRNTFKLSQFYGNARNLLTITGLRMALEEEDESLRQLMGPGDMTLEELQRIEEVANLAQKTSRRRTSLV